MFLQPAVLQSSSAAWQPLGDRGLLWLAGGRGKPINLPSFKRLTLDWEHISSGREGDRQAQSTKAGKGKTPFPDDLPTERARKRAFREVYNHPSRVKTQRDPKTGNKISIIEGEYGGRRYRLYLHHDKLKLRGHPVGSQPKVARPSPPPQTSASGRSTSSKGGGGGRRLQPLGGGGSGPRVGPVPPVLSPLKPVRPGIGGGGVSTLKTWQ